MPVVPAGRALPDSDAWGCAGSCAAGCADRVADEDEDEVEGFFGPAPAPPRSSSAGVGRLNKLPVPKLVSTEALAVSDDVAGAGAAGVELGGCGCGGWAGGTGAMGALFE